MSLTVEVVYREAMRLPRDARARLIERLLVDADAPIDPDIESEIVAMAESRLDEIRSGAVQPVDGEAVQVEARRLVGK